MKLSVNSQQLASELRLLNKVVPSKPTMAILSSVLLKADQRLTLEVTDLDVGLRTVCPAQVDQPGAVALPAAKLLQLVEQFPDTEVRIEAIDQRVTISAGAFQSKLQTLPADDFPRLPVPEGEEARIRIRPLIERTRFALPPSDKASKYIVRGALFTLNNVAAMVATDGGRLAIVTAAYQGPALSAIVPSKALDVLLGFEGEIGCSQTEQHLFFTSGERTILSRKLDTKFVAYERIVPRDNTIQISLNRAALAAVVRRVGVISETDLAIRLTLEGAALIITSASAKVGDATERLTLDTMYAPLTITTNWQYVLDFLQVAVNERITIALKDAQSPMLLLDGADFLCVVMLMRT